YMLRGIGQQRHMPGILQRHGQEPLVFGASARLAPRLNLRAVGKIAAQFVRLFVINLDHMVHPERADLAARTEVAPPATKAGTVATGPLAAIRAVAAKPFSAL